MKHIAFAARTLFPIPAREPARHRRRAASGRSSLLQQLVAVLCAATPLMVLVEAMAQTV